MKLFHAPDLDALLMEVRRIHQFRCGFGDNYRERAESHRNEIKNALDHYNSSRWFLTRKLHEANARLLCESYIYTFKHLAP